VAPVDINMVVINTASIITATASIGTAPTFTIALGAGYAKTGVDGSGTGVAIALGFNPVTTSARQAGGDRPRRRGHRAPCGLS
jgi:hypothetical protein